MNSARLQYVIRTRQRLPLPTKTLNASSVQLARYSDIRRKFPSRPSGNTSNKTPRQTSSESPGAPAPKPFKTQKRFSDPQMNKFIIQLLERLKLTWPNERHIYSRIPLPKHLAAAYYFYCMYSMDHVINLFDTQALGQQSYAENPAAVMIGLSYEKKKRDEPLWLWYSGSYQYGKSCIVISAGGRFIRAMRTALFVRGYNQHGKRLVSSSGGSDLRGTLRFYVTKPQEFRTQVTMKEVQEAVEYCLDYFIHQSQRRVTQFRPLANVEKSLKSRWASRKEMSKPHPSLRGLVYRPWLKKEDMIVRPQPEKERPLPRPQVVPLEKSFQENPTPSQHLQSAWGKFEKFEEKRPPKQNLQTAWERFKKFEPGQPPKQHLQKAWDKIGPGTWGHKDQKSSRLQRPRSPRP